MWGPWRAREGTRRAHMTPGAWPGQRPRPTEHAAAAQASPVAKGQEADGLQPL